jgi:mono/diheme cytochrome c family protein
MRALALVCTFIASLTGTKSDVEYNVDATVTGDTLEIVIDLSVLLQTPDPETGHKRALLLDDARAIAWLPGEKTPRAAMKLWPGGQAGQFRLRFKHTGEGYGFVRIDGLRGGKPFAVQVPLRVGAPASKQLPQKTIPPGGTPLLGDPALGRAVFSHHCGACHDKNIGEPRLQLSLSDDLYTKAVLTQPKHGPITALDERTRGELVSALEPHRLDMMDVAKAPLYLVREVKLTDEQKTTIRRITGQSPSIDTVTLYPLYDGPKTKDARRLADSGKDLDLANAKTRRGFLALVRDSDFDWWLQLDNNFVVRSLSMRTLSAKPLPRPELASFVGSGSKTAEDLPGKQRTDPVAQRVSELYAVVRLAAESYLAEETDRGQFLDP